MEGFESNSFPLPLEKQLALVELRMAIAKFSRGDLLTLLGNEVEALVSCKRAVRRLGHEVFLGVSDTKDYSFEDSLVKASYRTQVSDGSKEQLVELIVETRKSRYGHETYAASFSQMPPSEPFYRSGGGSGGSSVGDGSAGEDIA